MNTIEALRQEFSTVHNEAESLVKAADDAKRDLTADEETKLTELFGKLDAIKKREQRYTRLAEFKTQAGTITTPVEIPGRADADVIEGNPMSGAEMFFSGPQKAERIEQFKRAANKWASTGVIDARFATITTATQNGILLPTVVGAPIVATAPNTFRQAHDIYGVQTLKTSNTATLNLPVVDAQAGGVVSETASADTDAPPSLTESMVIGCKMYQSGSAWFSNLDLAAVDFDLFGATLPSLEYSKELGLESAIVAAMVADAGITQTVTTDTLAGFKYPTMTALNRALPKRFDQLKVIVLSTSAFIAAEGLVDANQRPIMQPDPQNQELKRFNGTPVLRSDYLQSLGTAGNVVGLVFSLIGFRLRDAAGEQIARYVNIPGRPAQSGFNLFQAHGWGYAVNAVAKLVNHA